MSGILKLNTPSTLVKDYLKMVTPSQLGQPAETGVLTYHGGKLKLSLGDKSEGINWYNLVTENLATNIAVATVSQDMQAYTDARYRINHPLDTKNIVPALYIGDFLHNEKIHSFETEDSSNVVISFETSVSGSKSAVRLVLVGQYIAKDASWIQSLPPSGNNGNDSSSNQELGTGGNDTSTGDVSTGTGNENTEPDKDNGEGGETGGDVSTGDGDDPGAQSEA